MSLSYVSFYQIYSKNRTSYLDETGYTSSEDDNSRSGHYQSIKHVAHKPSKMLTNQRPGGGLNANQIRSPQDTSDNSLIPAMHYTPGKSACCYL